MTQYITQKRAGELADSVESSRYGNDYDKFLHALCNDAIQHYIDSLPKSEPYCWLYKGDMGDVQIFFVDPPLYSKPLYTSPQPALSKEDAEKVLEAFQIVWRVWLNEVDSEEYQVQEKIFRDAITIMQSAIGVMK